MIGLDAQSSLLSDAIDLVFSPELASNGIGGYSIEQLSTIPELDMQDATPEIWLFGTNRDECDLTNLEVMYIEDRMFVAALHKSAVIASSSIIKRQDMNSHSRIIVGQRADVHYSIALVRIPTQESEVALYVLTQVPERGTNGKIYRLHSSLGQLTIRSVVTHFTFCSPIVPSTQSKDTVESF